MYPPPIQIQPHGANVHLLIIERVSRTESTKSLVDTRHHGPFTGTFLASSVTRLLLPAEGGCERVPTSSCSIITKRRAPRPPKSTSHLINNTHSPATSPNITTDGVILCS